MKMLMTKIIAVITMLAAINGSFSADKPLKIYILVGQSNMQGQAKLSTLPHMAIDPKTTALHDKIVDKDGNYLVYKDIHVAAFSEGGKPAVVQEKHGPLTVGFGSDLTKDDVCGLEIAFGVTMYESLREPILLIKTSWGGKSINTDFRPPSAGPYPFSESQLDSITKRGKETIEEAKAQRAKETGHYYRLMAAHVQQVLSDPGRYHPAYNKSAGHEIAGFVWFQGWNDMVDGSTYPNRFTPGGYDAYSEVLGHFIRDVRKEFNAPKMSFAIGVIGVDGPTKDYKSPRYKDVHQYFRDAMAAPAALPEFTGNVQAVLTELYWPADAEKVNVLVGEINKLAEAEAKKEQATNPNLKGKALGEWIQQRVEELQKQKLTPEEQRLITIGWSNAGFHYLGSLKCYSQIGEALARATLKMNSVVGNIK